MRRLSKMKLEEIIKYEQECTYIDFKKGQYKNKENLIKDIMAMANADYDGEKYIIIGVKFIPGKEKYIEGINEQIEDDSNYQQLINENIEPNINFAYYSEEIDNKKIAYFIIYDNNIDKPYMMKKKYNSLESGDAFKRVGSSQKKLTRNDLDNIYKHKYSWELEINKGIEQNIRLINLELNFIETLKKYNEYLISENNYITNLLDSYKSCINERRWSIKNIPSTMSEIEWKQKALIDITSFSISQIDVQVDEKIFQMIEPKYFKGYNNIISCIKNDHIYLLNLQKELREVKKIKWDFHNDCEINSLINKIFTRKISNYFSIPNYFCLKSEFNYIERIDELNDKLIQLKSKREYS